MDSSTDKVFLYIDNSNIYIAAQHAAVEKEGTAARYRVRLDFHNLYELARAGREVKKALAVGSVPPELRQVWNKLENEGIQVQLLERGETSGSEQGVDAALQTAMLRDALDNNGHPGTVVLLTGDGRGFHEGAGFHADIERMHKKGWHIEIISWLHSAKKAMREWAEENGKFIALDIWYENITFLAPPRPGEALDPPRRDAVSANWSKRL